MTDSRARTNTEPAPPPHRRVIRRPPMPIGPIRRIKRVQIHLPNRTQHRPNQMILRHPIAQRRRHQIRLIPITLNEVLACRHGLKLNPPDVNPFPDSHRSERLSRPQAAASYFRSDPEAASPRAEAHAGPCHAFATPRLNLAWAGVAAATKHGFGAAATTTSSTSSAARPSTTAVRHGPASKLEFVTPVPPRAIP